MKSPVRRTDANGSQLSAPAGGTLAYDFILQVLWIREHYELCAERLSRGDGPTGDGIYKSQLYSPNSNGYGEERSTVCDVFANRPVVLVFDVPVPYGRLRLDPANCQSVVEIPK